MRFKEFSESSRDSARAVLGNLLSINLSKYGSISESQAEQLACVVRKSFAALEREEGEAVKIGETGELGIGNN